MFINDLCALHCSRHLIYILNCVQYLSRLFDSINSIKDLSFYLFGQQYLPLPSLPSASPYKLEINEAGCCCFHNDWHYPPPSYWYLVGRIRRCLTALGQSLNNKECLTKNIYSSSIENHSTLGCTVILRPVNSFSTPGLDQALNKPAFSTLVVMTCLLVQKDLTYPGGYLF